jgi:hypothetical protein
MDASTLLLLLLILACPLMMIFMMRGHGGGGHGHGAGEGCHAGSQSEAKEPLRDLRRRRDELDALIEEREAEEAQNPPTFAGQHR